MTVGPRRLRISFGATTLPHYEGVYLLHGFLTRIGFKRALGQDLHLAQRTNRYSVGEMLLALLYPMILGLERLKTTHLRRYNGVIQYLAGLPSYLNSTILHRFLPTALPKQNALQIAFCAGWLCPPCHLPD